MSTKSKGSVARERLEARITPEQKALLRRAAGLRGQTLTNFVISSVHEAALRTIEVADVVRLTRRDQEFFVKAVTNPPVANANLRRAAARYRAGWSIDSEKR